EEAQASVTLLSDKASYETGSFLELAGGKLTPHPNPLRKGEGYQS
ncbi:hypothetical protein ACVGWO_09115, partial [Enterobacter asburiae]